MRAVVQRVTRGRVLVDEQVVGEIGVGLVVLLGITHDDTDDTARAMADKLAGLRVLEGDLSVVDAGAETLVVSQFTLYGDTRKGRRPSWSAAAPGPVAEPLYEAVVARLREIGVTTATGRFGALMSVELVGDGPFTVLVEL